MVLTATVITLYGPTPTFTVFSTFPRHTPPEVNFRHAVLRAPGTRIVKGSPRYCMFQLTIQEVAIAELPTAQRPTNSDRHSGAV